MLAGEVRLGPGGARAAKPGQMVAEDELAEVDERPAFVSRGGIKLANALERSGWTPRDGSASTLARRRADSPTACSSGAPSP